MRKVTSPSYTSGKIYSLMLLLLLLLTLAIETLPVTNKQKRLAS